MKKITVILIDDHTLMRDAIANSLETDPNFKVIASTSDVLAAIEIAALKKPDIILLDINMPEITGFDLIVDIRVHSPESKIIGMSAYTLPVYAKKIMKLGANGYLTKNSTLEEMVMAIHEVHKGNFFICNEVKNKMVEVAMNADEGLLGFHLLTEIELEVFRLLNKDLNSRQIAQELNLRKSAVDVHRSSILKKLQVKNMSTAIRNYHSMSL